MDNVGSTPTAAQPASRAQKLGANFSNLSAVEIGAQRGIGPLSPLGQRVWHGETRPCVSCGQLVRRTSGQCENCGQLLTGDMIQKMRGMRTWRARRLARNCGSQRRPNMATPK